MTARPPYPALDVNASASESLDHVADLFESGAIVWTPWPLEDGAAFTLLAAVNEFAADVDPAPQLLPLRAGAGLSASGAATACGLRRATWTSPGGTRCPVGRWRTSWRRCELRPRWNLRCTSARTARSSTSARTSPAWDIRQGRKTNWRGRSCAGDAGRIVRGEVVSQPSKSADSGRFRPFVAGGDAYSGDSRPFS